MIGCRNYSTPINYRVTNLAEGSAGISVFGTSSLFIRKSYGIMNVSCAAFCLESNIRETCLKLGINTELLVGECTEHIRGITVNISDLAHINVNLKVIRP